MASSDLIGGSARESRKKTADARNTSKHDGFKSAAAVTRNSRSARRCRTGRKPASSGQIPKPMSCRTANAHAERNADAAARPRPAALRPAKSGNAIHTAPWCPLPDLSYVEVIPAGGRASVKDFTLCGKIAAECLLRQGRRLWPENLGPPGINRLPGRSRSRVPRVRVRASAHRAGG